MTATIPHVEVVLDPDDFRAHLVADARAGLTAEPKALPPVWFYDERGSQLFDEITRLDEYYPTRAERALLQRHAPEIARLTGADTLVELGSGTSDKTRALLDAMAAEGSLARYVPLDVSEETLVAASASIASTYGIEVHALVADFTRHLDRLPRRGRRLLAFLGSTIGNLAPVARAAFLRQVGAQLGAGEWFLLGADLVKDRARLVAAYDDARGVTAEFNRNVLRVLDRELGADFDVEDFDHHALWDEDQRWIEMRLRARRPLVVHVAGLGLDIRFAEGEELRTETSAKFTVEQLHGELTDAGLAVKATFGAEAGEFVLLLATPV